MMPAFPTIDLKRWIEHNRHLYDPPYKTNRILAHHSEFFVLMLHGPNMRLDFHREPGEEFFFQVHGDIELHLKPEGERRRVVNIREGEMFLCPGGLAHSPRRGAGTWGVVIERKRKADETEEFLWFCECCDEQVLARTITQDSDTGAQVTAIYEAFNAEPPLRTCSACGYVFPVAPRAQRLGFLENDKR